jgi:hypothetical protein
MCTTTTGKSSSLDCNSFKVLLLPIMTGGNSGNINEDRICGKTVLIMSVVAECAEVLAYRDRIPSAGCAIHENACKQRHEVHHL